MALCWEHSLAPRFSDVDGLRHINNTVVPVWFEEARMPLMARFCPDFSLDTWTLITARVEVDFLSQMVLNQTVRVKTWILDLGRASFRVAQEAYQGGVCAARGMTVLVHYDFALRRTMAIPQSIADHLLPYTFSEEERERFLADVAARARSSR